ncbi:MAG: hypothetical protein GY859_43510 [Desulfobacterales bacterium]|nr:hypothetical protein [Desulfobacterales bacterium]
MFHPPTRRVRTVRLRAPSHSLLKRGEILLEDALRTASIPAAETGRLLIVRSLSVGAIQSRRGSSSLALAIERRLRRIRIRAVYAGAATDQDAVYFHDDAEPYILLARRIARGESPRAWFWPLAVPAWRPSMARGEAMRALFYGVTRTRAGVGAGARMVRELHEKNALQPLLAALQPGDGAQLMRTFGWKSPDAPERVEEPIPRGWESLLLHWTRQWGPGDLRATLTACLALVAENPVRLMDPGLASRAGSLLRTIARGVNSPDAFVDKPLSNKAPAEKDPTRAPASFEPRARGSFRRAPRTSTPSDSHPEPRSSEMEDFTGPPGNRRLMKKTENQDSRPGEWRKTGETLHRRPTEYAGLFHLTSVLVRLGMADFLKKSPHWIERQLPQRFFVYVCDILRIPPDDPVGSALEIRRCAKNQWPSDFMAPEVWRRGIMKGDSSMLRRMKESPGVRVLFDGSGNLMTASWRRDPPDGLREFVREHSLKRGPVMAAEPGLDLALKAWLEAVRRWLRMQSNLELEEVVRRPGEIAVTPTHIDLFFNLDRLDIRIRKAGLDIDPGWVPWLARVIYFHYSEANQQAQPNYSAANYQAQPNYSEANYQA